MSWLQPHRVGHDQDPRLSGRVVKHHCIVYVRPDTDQVSLSIREDLQVLLGWFLEKPVVEFSESIFIASNRTSVTTITARGTGSALRSEVNP